VGKPKRCGSGFSAPKPAAAPKQQVTNSSVDHTAKEQQAIALANQGKLKEAGAIYRELIAAGTSNHITYGNLAAICGIQGKANELMNLVARCLELRPDYPDGYNIKGNGHRELGDIEAAIAAYKKAIEIKPEYPECLYHLGAAYKEKGAISEAIKCYQKAIELQPEQAGALYNLGVLFQEQGEIATAKNCYAKAIKIDPSNPESNWNYCVALLTEGDYSRGLEKHEWRWKRDRAHLNIYAKPKCRKWEEDELPRSQEKLLLIAEQGLGDTLQFMRYVIALRSQEIAVSLCVQPKLHTLIQASGIDPSPLTPEQANQVSEGHWIPLLSVPRILKVTPDNPIITEPYIKTKKELIGKWKSILSAERRPIIGINWQGSPDQEKTGFIGRSLPLVNFASIATKSNAKLLSLQKGFGSEQLESCSFKDRIVSCQDQINDTWDFLETAAIIANCDLVITSDTSMAHLAGGMGKTTWLLLKKVPEWRWGLEGDTTFWYPCMRLFRQKEMGDWDEVMERVAEALQEHFPDNPATTRATPAPSIKPEPIQDIQAPISLGELIDKITILQIKTKHLQCTALENVKKELEALETTLNNLQLNIAPTLIQRLKEINQDLWQIEDDIREQERRKNFSETFIELARSVYQQNDRRAAIKKEINTTYGSAFVEEKSYKEYTHKGDRQARIHSSQDTPQWETIAITIEPQGQRYAEFKSNNNHLEITPFTAIKGSDLSKQEIISQGLATEELMATNLWTAGGIGCAASHRYVRDQVANGSKGYLVLEDDCYTHPRIADFISSNLDQLMATDICFFGTNTDSILQSVSPTGLVSVSIFEPKHPNQEWIRNALSKTRTEKVEIHRLLKAFGLYSYFISPSGARRLNQRTFPLSLRTTAIPLITRHMPAAGTDRAGCGIYSQLKAFVCHPFLAYTPNTDSSTK